MLIHYRALERQLAISVGQIQSCDATKASQSRAMAAQDPHTMDQGATCHCKPVQDSCSRQTVWTACRGLLAEQREAYEVFDLGNFALQGGRTIRNAKLAYK